MLPDGKVALITGATGGIGSAVARRLSAGGDYDRIWLQGRSVEKLAILSQALEAEFPTIHFQSMACQLLNQQHIHAQMQQMFKASKRLDTLVNAAGIMPTGQAQLLGQQQLEEIFAINVNAAIFTSQMAARLMARKKTGTILFIGSRIAHLGGAGMAAYAASKAAISAYGVSLARELGPLGVRVNIVEPGVIETNLLDNFDNERKEHFAVNTSLGRLGKPEDVADTIAFLCSDAASYITGQSLSVDGNLII